MAGLCDHAHARARDAAADRLGLIGRRRRILVAGEHEDGSSDRAEGVAGIPVGERLAAAGVALGLGRDHHRAVGAHELGVLAVRPRREPQREHRVGDRLHALGAHGRGALQPVLAQPEAGRRARQHEAVDPLGRVHREPHPDGAAEREAAERDALEAALVEDGEHAARELLDRPRRRRAAPLAVTGMVVAEHAEALAQRRHLRLPHRERRPQRVREHDDRGVLGAVEARERHSPKAGVVKKTVWPSPCRRMSKR